MIRVNIKKEKGFITGFEVSGHAEYNEYGKDIVCSAVTILTFNTIDTFTDILDMSDKIKINILNNEISLNLLNNEFKTYEKYQLIMRKYELGIQSIVKSYGDYIELNYTEV